MDLNILKKKVIMLNYINEREQILKHEYNKFKFVKYLSCIYLENETIQSNNRNCIL